MLLGFYLFFTALFTTQPSPSINSSKSFIFALDEQSARIFDVDWLYIMFSHFGLLNFDISRSPIPIFSMSTDPSSPSSLVMSYLSNKLPPLSIPSMQILTRFAPFNSRSVCQGSQLHLLFDMLVHFNRNSTFT